MPRRKEPDDSRFAKAKDATRSLVRAVMALVEAHYRGGDLDPPLEALVASVRELPKGDRLTIAEHFNGARELTEAIAIAARSEARAYLPKKSWQSPIAQHLAALKNPAEERKVLFWEYSEIAREQGKKRPTKISVIREVADRHGMDPENLRKRKGTAPKKRGSGLVPNDMAEPRRK